MQLFFLLFLHFYFCTYFCTLFLHFYFCTKFPRNFIVTKNYLRKIYFLKITNSSSISSQFARKKFISCQYPAPKRPYS